MTDKKHPMHSNGNMKKQLQYFFNGKLAIVAVILLLMMLFFALDLQQYLRLDYLQQKREIFSAYYADNQWLVLSLFFTVYVIVTALSLPVAAMLTLLAGALFGFVTGLIVVSFASSIGATVAFLLSRWLFKDAVQQKYGQYLQKINQGVQKEGAFYLFALRLVPVIPFFLVNLLMAITPIRLLTFYIVSQVAMLAGTAVYVYAGTELGQLSALSDIMSPRLWIAFALLGLFPLVAKKTVQWLRAQQDTKK